MVTHLLHQCGLYLGKSEDILPPVPGDNEKGYWENAKFVSINEALLAALGGSWGDLPVSEEGWAKQKMVLTLRVKSEIMLQEFLGHEPWGWKDPRNCLTMPFWATLNSLTLPFWLNSSPKLKVVICLRNPVEVTQSLLKRNYPYELSALNLWRIYNEHIIYYTLPEDRIITHYESYFHDAQTELRRVLDFLDMPLSAELIDNACTIVSDDLRRHRLITDRLQEECMPAEVLDLYLNMCREANYLEPLGIIN
jgi:hypothetical protein